MTSKFLDKLLEDMKYAAGPDDAEKIIGSNMTNQTAFVSSEISDYIPDSFILNRRNSDISTYGESVRILKNGAVDVTMVLENHLKGRPIKVIVSRIGDWLSFIESDCFLIRVKDTSNSVKIDISGDMDWVKLILKYIEDEFDVVTISVDWVTSKDMDTTSLPLLRPKGVKNSSYPFIEEGVDEFISNFLESEENVLMLIGPPGTGKSMFISHLIAKSKVGAMITYDPDIMSKDTIFANFIESSNGAFVMEDADAFLTARSEGNLSMHRFLNVSSGIVSMKNKKLIFSTNLESTDEIDPALLRPGRCFDIVQFRKLTVDESNNFLKDHGFDITVDKAMTLAELYNMTGRNRKTKRKSIGFV